MSFAGGTWLAGNSGQPAPPILDAALLLLLLLSSRLIMLVSAGLPWSASLVGETLKDTLFLRQQQPVPLIPPRRLQLLPLFSTAT